MGKHSTIVAGFLRERNAVEVPRRERGPGIARRINTMSRARENPDVAGAEEGTGPLLQRDYWAVVAGSKVRASAMGEVLAERFAEFAPEPLVSFARADGAGGPLQVGDTLDVRIRLAGAFGVRVLHRDANSLTLGTIRGHPEAGRITFGAYPNDDGDLVFHIRSRARASTTLRFAQYLAAGEGMQTATWADFIATVAATVGDGVRGDIVAQTQEIGDGRDEDGDGPTFLAEGG